MNNLTVMTGWFFSAAISIVFFIGAYAQFTYDIAAKASSTVPELPDWTHIATAISLIIAACLHLVPQSSFATLGAIVMTGMIGGMIGTLLMQENPMWWTRAVMGVLPWLGLYLRDEEFNLLMSFWR